MVQDDQVKMAAMARLLRQALVLAEGGNPKPPSSENSTVGFMVNLLQAETQRLDQAKKEVHLKDQELTLKLSFAKNKEKELADREAEIDKLEAQLRVRESQIKRREEALK